MKFTEFTISTTTEASELVADLLWQYTTYGVAVCDYKDVIELIENRNDTFDYIDDNVTEPAELKQCTLVKAYVELGESKRVSQSLNEDLLMLKENSLGYIDCGTLEVAKRVVEGDDWIEIWKKHFRPINYGKIVICPKWINYEKTDDQQVIYIDSNMAFGTGEHETTSMCIELLECYVTEKDVVLDIGTGSGILGISAIKLGAAKSVMTDIDKVAVMSAEHNAEINGVADKCTVLRSDLIDGINDVASLAVANITADILVRLASDISKQLKKDGILIMSGIILSKLDFVLAEFIKFGFKTIEVVNKGEWYAVVMQNVGL